LHLIIAKYTSDAERKRIEYAIDKWREQIRISRPDGITVLADGDDSDITRFLEELYSKALPDGIAHYRVEAGRLDVEPTERQLKLRIFETLAAVEKVLRFIMTRLRATLREESREPRWLLYELQTKKGKVEVSATLREDGIVVNVDLRISGYGQGVDLVRDRLREELKYLKGGEYGKRS